MTASLSTLYRHKIKTVEELAALIGPRPRQRKVIMCHGVFDIVHPGHLRHLIYAKGKADILIASLTADPHIEKGHHRPHVPQDLRALNLAAFEIVDYVIIDAESTPLRNLAIVQPDFFAKGYEYFASGLPPKTQTEVDVVEAYGGEVIFTPGDVVYSSSRVIDQAPPNLKIEKLQLLMERDGFDFDRLRMALSQLKGRRVHVLGDTIVDSYTQTAVIGGQVKTPTLSVLYERRTDFIGGAAIVAKHLRAAGADVVFSTVVGDDGLKDFVLRDMKDAGIDIRAIIDPTRPTTNKNAIVAGGYRLLKLDTVDNRSISDIILEKLAAAVSDTLADAIVFSDFRHGIFNRRTIPSLIRAIPPGMFKVADSQVASRWGNILDFQGFDLITPNEREARFTVGDQDSGVRPLAHMIYDQAQCRTLILKLGERGVMTCYRGEADSTIIGYVVDSFVDNVVDAVGAGDALLAYATLALLATGSEAIATVLGSLAAACECERDGNVPVTLDDIRAKIDSIERLVHFS